jgi:hypothetical protein
MKKILAAVVVAGVLALAVVYFRMGAIAKSVIETHGPKMLGVPVEIGAVILSPFSGKARLTGLRVGNPPGFKGDTAFRLNDVSVHLDLKTLSGSGPVRVHEILIDGPVIYFEAGPQGSNLARIQRNLEAYSPAKDSSNAAEKAQAERKISIGLFRLSGGKVSASIPKVAEPQTTELPVIELKDINATPAEISKQVIGQLTRAALKATGGVEALLERGAKALGGDAGKAVDAVRGLLFKKKK